MSIDLGNESPKGSKQWNLTHQHHLFTWRTTPNLRFMHRPTKRWRGWKRSAASCLLKHSTYLHHRSLLPLSFQRDHLHSWPSKFVAQRRPTGWRYGDNEFPTYHLAEPSNAAVNLRCTWVPGCISPLRPLRPADSINRPMQSDGQASLSLASKQLRDFLNEASFSSSREILGERRFRLVSRTLRIRP